MELHYLFKITDSINHRLKHLVIKCPQKTTYFVVYVMSYFIGNAIVLIPTYEILLVFNSV